MAILSCGLWRWAVGTAAWERERGGDLRAGWLGYGMEECQPVSSRGGEIGG
jgi:hypothetical protein